MKRVTLYQVIAAGQLAVDWAFGCHWLAGYIQTVTDLMQQLTVVLSNLV
jgi:hypothetical protein